MAGPRARILVVEDAEEVRELLVLLLEGAGFSVVSCEDADRAFVLVQRERPDLVLTDLMLGAWSGLDLTRDRDAGPLLCFVGAALDDRQPQVRARPRDRDQVSDHRRQIVAELEAADGEHDVEGAPLRRQRSISCERSIPTTSTSGASSHVSWPGPHPTSSTRTPGRRITSFKKASTESP